jgi:hypothetical protein
VLKTAQLERYRPSVICVEEGEHHDEIKRYLGGWGYRYDVTLGKQYLCSDDVRSKPQRSNYR